ncbi:MAG: hypothetical protein HYY22_08095 [Thaumarchaeota archaeon]|nr:hypothetical protein [Nitrososphaerota archaeon]
MNYLPIRIVPGNTVHKITSITIAALLITSLLVGLIPVMPAASAASMSVSQTTIGANNAIKITISDSALTNHPTVTLSWGTASSVSLTNNMFKTPLGDWILFIANNTSTLPANATLRIPPSILNGTVGTGTTGDLNNKTAITSDNKTLVETVEFNEGNVGVTSATLTYGERSETISLTLGNPAVSGAAAGRSSAPPNSILPITVVDPKQNLDPTVVDGSGKFKSNFNYTKINVAVNGENKTLTTAYSHGSGVPVGSGNVTETGIITGNFTLYINLAQYNVTNGDLVTVTVFDKADPTKSTAASVPVSSVNGILSAPSTVTYATSINVTLTDADRNLDTKTTETLTSGDINVVATIAGVPLKANVTMKETGKNTGVFYGTVNVAIGAAGLTGNVSNSVTFAVPAGSATSFVASYTDPTSVTANWQSQATFSLSITTPTIALDNTAYLPAASIPATLTLTNPNANDDPLAIERLTINNRTNLNNINWLNVNGTQAGLPVLDQLNITETKSGVTRTLNYSGLRNKQFVETGINTGVFTLNFDLETALNGTRTAGSTITIKLYDKFAKTMVTTSATIGGTLSTIVLDRTTLPLPLGEQVSVTVTVTDPKANSNPSAINTANVTLLAYNATNQRVNISNTDGANAWTVSLTESDVNTGIFTGTVKYLIVSNTGNVNVTVGSTQRTLHNINGNLNANVSGKQMVNGKLVFGYADPLATGGNVTATGTISPSTATLSVSPTSVNLNGTLVVTVTEPDENLSPTSINTIHANIYDGTTVVGPITLTETGKNTGVFSGNASVGAVGSIFQGFGPGDTVTVKYKDNATATSYYGTGLATQALSVTATVPTHTATMSLNAASYGPFSKVIITVTDADLVFNTTAQVTLARVQTGNETLTDEPAMKSYSNGTFTWTYNLFVKGTAVKELMTFPVDTLNVFYVDAVDAAGNTGAITTKTATITSVTGTVTITPNTALVGQFVNVTVADSDQNKDSTIIESVNIVVTSTSWAIGQTILLAETAPNTGVFSTQVQFTSGIPAGNQIRVATGDTVTAKYTDKWNATGLQSSVTATATVGTSQVATERVPASTPSLVDTSGNAVTAPTAGSLVVVQAAVRNNATTSQTITYIVQVKNANGQVVFLNWIQNMTLSVGQTSTPGISWTPSAAGTYTIQVFVWDSLTGAQARSPVFTQTVTVS